MHANRSAANRSVDIQYLRAAIECALKRFSDSLMAEGWGTDDSAGIRFQIR